MHESITDINDDDRPIYRFVSFYEIYELIINKRLRMSKVSTFEDRNEGIGEIISIQENVMSLYSFRTQDSVLEQHKNVIYNNYFSCWTQQPDTVAMWSLYSKDNSSFRIKTKCGKLLKAISNIKNSICINNSNANTDKRRLVSTRCYLGDVEYVDFFNLRKNLHDKFEEYKKKVRDKSSSDISYLKREDGLKLDFNLLFENRLINKSGLLLKDKSYEHESEIRAILNCIICNGIIDNDIEKQDNNYFEFVTSDELPNYIYTNVEDDFIDEICFDPRMENYKKKVYEQIFCEYGTKLVNSKTFGYALEQENFAYKF